MVTNSRVGGFNVRSVETDIVLGVCVCYQALLRWCNHGGLTGRDL
jgi:hypothetical protein